MKRISRFLIVLTLLAGFEDLRAQTLTFLFKNPQVIAGPRLQYEIWLRSSNGTSRMGDILVYNDYDTTAFGASVVLNGKVTVTKNSAVFGDSYSTNSNNDNTPSRFAFSWNYFGPSGSGVIIPSTGDGVLAYTVQLQIASSSMTSGITLSSLMNGEQYFDDHTAWPSIDITSTLNVPLVGTPILFSPSNGATGLSISPTLSWNVAPGATSYRLQVSTDSTFATTIVNDSTLTDTSRQVGPLTNNTTYYWRVNAKNTSGTSAFSTVWHFATIVLPPAAPTLLFPANGATGVSANPVLRWNVSSGATSYRVQVSTDPSLAATIVNQGGVTDTSLALGGLNNSTTYYWRVNATNSGGTSAYSTVFSFTTTAGVSPPAAPTLLSPPNGATNVPLGTSLRWNTPIGAASYNLQGSEDSTFLTLSFVRNGIVDTSASSLPLLNNTKYFWRVNAANAAGPGPYSLVWSFTTIATAPAAPTLVYPPDGALGVPIDTTLAWNASSGAISYRLQVSTNSSFTSLIVDDPTLATTSKRIGPLSNSSLYFWRVSASNAGGTSSYSTTRSFTTILAAPTLDSPPDEATEVPTNPTLRWNASSGAASYRLQVFPFSPGSSTVVDTAGITATSYSVSGLASISTYSWRVNATNAGGTSAWSAVWTFTTILLPPAAPTLLSPTDGATGVSVTPMLEWLPSTNATSYRIQVSTNSNFSSIILDDSTQATAKQVGPLAFSTLYFWRVSASNAAGTSAFSSVRNFTTTITTVEKDEGAIPKSFNLYPNFPNPFNPSTTIEYDLPIQAFVTLKVYNALKQEVATLISEEQTAGRYRAKFEAGNLASGVYLYRILARPNEAPRSAGFAASNKMLLLK